MIDDFDPDRNENFAEWLNTMLGRRHRVLVGPSPHRPDALIVRCLKRRRIEELWIPGGPLPSPAAIRRLVEVAKRLARVQHPNLITILELDVHEGRPYLLLQPCPGPSLSDRVAEQPPSPQQAVALCLPLARAVHALHEAGLVQLDLMPGAIFLDDEGWPKIDPCRTLERRASEADGAGYWCHGGITGCEAPELVRDAESEIGRETDVYALGAILFRLLTARAPLIHGSVGAEALRKIREGTPERPRSFNRSVDRALESICLRCLARHPKDRFGTAESLAEALMRWQAGGRRSGWLARLW